MLTIRQALRELLVQQPFSALELSRQLSLPEKEILFHLQELARSPGHHGRLEIIPAVCNNCGFTFRKRTRLTSPSRCPLCRHESIQRPRFTLIIR